MNIKDLRTKPQDAVSIPGSQVMTVFGPKGGVGKTFLAVNLAILSAKRGARKTLLVDLDLDSGDVAVHLDLPEGSSINDLLPYCSDIRPEVMPRFVSRHHAGALDVLMAPPRPELSEFVKVEHVSHLIEGARRIYQCIVIDTPPAADCDIVYECLEKSDSQLLVITQDLACLRQARTSLELMRRLGLNVNERTHVVLNQFSEKSILSVRKVREFLDFARVQTVSHDRDVVERSILDGAPIVLAAGGCQVGREICAIASQVLGIGEGQLQPSRRGFGLFKAGRRLW